MTTGMQRGSACPGYDPVEALLPRSIDNAHSSLANFFQQPVVGKLLVLLHGQGDGPPLNPHPSAGV